ncbi:DUF1772 domain-containing protein [bacterium]|nr:MAG: DUF1772 domain-containing protein [bacterium]
MAGVFFAFSTFVMGALRRLPPDDGMAAMRQINARALNSLFLLEFLGMALLTLYLAWEAYSRGRVLGMAYLWLGSLSYFVGTFLVTVAGNVPLNRQLDAAQPGDQAVWDRYVVRWTMWNHLRTASSLLALWTFTMSFMDQSHAMLPRF